MARRLAVVALGLVAFAVPWLARAEEPTPERLRSAAEEYDKGRRAYLAGEFEASATHFENAYRDAPRAEALRSALRARQSAKQNARAATLAAFAQAKYGADPATAELATKTIAELGGALHALAVRCEPDCAVVADGRLASLAEAPRVVVYLDPGPHDIVVSWPGDRAHKTRIVAKAAGKDELSLHAPDAPPPPVPTATGTATAPPPPHEEPTRKPLAPVFFLIGAGATVVLGGITVWSGIDTTNNPGKDAVRRDCVGQDESCPTYQKGKSAELRTNILLGATAGMAVVTGVVGVFFTRWRDPSAPARSATLPWVVALPGGAAAGVTRTF